MNKKNISILNIMLLVILLIYTLSMVMLLLWGVSTSLKSVDEFRLNVIGLPKTFEFGNFPFVLNYFYVPILTSEGFRKYVGLSELLLNTLLYAGGCAFLATLTPCIVAYLTAKFHYRFSKIVYSLVLITMILPIVGSFPSEIQLLTKLGIYDKIYSPWIQKTNFLGMFYLVFYATFKGISKEYTEAAYVDGASEMKILTRIMLPLVKNAFLVIMLIKFIEFWNDYQSPLLYIPSYPTLAFGIYYLSRSSNNNLSNVPMRMAGCIMLITPILILFIIFRNKLIGNLSMGGVKG